MEPKPLPSLPGRFLPGARPSGSPWLSAPCRPGEKAALKGGMTCPRVARSQGLGAPGFRRSLSIWPQATSLPHSAGPPRETCPLCLRAAFSQPVPAPLFQPTSSPCRSMANLSILFGQVSCSQVWGCGRQIWAAVMHVTRVLRKPGVRRRGHCEPFPPGRGRRPGDAAPSLEPRPPSPQARTPPQVVRGLSAGARVFEYMTLSPGIPLSGGCSLPRERLHGSITFHNVSFR